MADAAGLLSHFFIKIDGADPTQQLQGDLLDVMVETNLHLPAMATFTLNDSALHWIDDPTIWPGKTLEVLVDSDKGSKTLFEGEIVELEPEFGPGMHRIVVRAFDRLHRLTRGRKVRTFLNVTDADLASTLAGEVGLSTDLGPASIVYDYVIQHNQTDLEFLRGRAESLGFTLCANKKTLVFKPPSPNGADVELEWGKNLSEFRPRLTTVDQIESATVRGWDPEARQEIIGQAQDGSGAPEVGVKQNGASTAKSAHSVTAKGLVTDRPVRTQAEADTLARAQADIAAARFIEAEGSCAGNPAVIAGTQISIAGVGTRFSGKYLVTAATHHYTPSGGHSVQFSVSRHRPANMLAVLSEGVTRSERAELMVGIVTDNQDPLDEGRVKVRFPNLSSNDASTWARLVAPGAGPERGLEFIPEVNDEVLVGFELGDMHRPYILGGLWNGRDAPPIPTSQAVSGGKVVKRVIKSRAGHIITLDDSDGGGGITIEDKSGNHIAIDSKSNAMSMEVSGNVTLKAQGNVSVEAQGQVDIKGTGIKLESSGSVDIKGAIVNLN